MAKEPVVAILGATGAVGQEFIRLIEERKFPYSKLKLLASARSAGKTMTVNGQEYTIEEAKPESFDGVDIGLFAGGSISKTLGPEAAKRGCIVIDNSSTFRMDPDVPLVVPEVNPGDIAWHKGIIANPNCSTIIMLMALKPIHDLSPIKKIIVSTYQAVSGAGTNCTRSALGSALISPTISSSNRPGTFQLNCSGVRRESAFNGMCTVTPSSCACGSYT